MTGDEALKNNRLLLLAQLRGLFLQVADISQLVTEKISSEVIQHDPRPHRVLGNQT